MTEFFDPLGDDSDLLENTEENTNSEFCDNPTHDHDDFDISNLPEDVKSLPKLLPFVELSHMINDIVLKDTSAQAEQEAIIYSLIEVIGKEKFDNNIAAARHSQRSRMWSKIADIYEEVITQDIIKELNDDHDDDSTLMVVLRASLETSKDIACMNRDKHFGAFMELDGTYDTDMINSTNYSFKDWEESSIEFMSELKSSVSVIVESINKIFKNLHGKFSH